MVAGFSGEAVTNGNAFASPSILEGGLTSTTIQVDSPNALTLEVKLYNIAGELIRGRESKGPVGLNQASLDLEGLSSGLYLAVVDLRDADGGFVGRQVAKIILKR